MNLRVVLSISSVGILMGAATSFGLTQGLEWVLWVVIALFSAYLIAKRAPKRPVLHGSSVGFLCGVLNAATQSLLFDTFVANNPGAAERLGRISMGMDPRLFLLASGAAVALAAGVLFGVLALLAFRLEHRSADGPTGRS